MDSAWPDLLSCVSWYVGFSSHPPVYPTSVSITPGTSRRISSTPQKQPPASTATSVFRSLATAERALPCCSFISFLPSVMPGGGPRCAGSPLRSCAPTRSDALFHRGTRRLFDQPRNLRGV